MIPKYICTFDLETTGVDMDNDRILQAFVGLMDHTGEWVQKIEWLIDPGVPVPEGASDVHGYTTERIQAVGRKDNAQAILEIHDAILWATLGLGEDVPLVIYNATFDTTMLDREMKRYHGYGFNMAGINVVDPLVIDKGLDKYRRGSRKLVDVAPVYNVPVEENAHDAGVDCLMTGRVALAQLRKVNNTYPELMERQKEWKHEQATSFQEYLRSDKNPKGADPEAYINPNWPMQ